MSGRHLSKFWREFSDPLRASILRAGWFNPTSIQQAAIPAIAKGGDIILTSRTGSGKTAAFLLPILQRLGGHSTTVGARAVMVSPTRELALQSATTARRLAKDTGLKVACLVGGEALETQYDTLAANPDIIFCTPGRLLHCLKEADLRLDRVQFVVFDEADRLFSQALEQQVVDILELTPRASRPGSVQVVMASATIPDKMKIFSKAHLDHPLLLELEEESRVPDTLSLAVFVTRAETRTAALLALLERAVYKNQATILFVPTHHHGEFLEGLLTHVGYTCLALSGRMDHEARNAAVGKFTKGKVQILITTDVAARGIDIPSVEVVLNYDCPYDTKNFLHRVGRAARAGRAGRALTIVARSDDLPYAIDAFEYLRRPINFPPSSAGPYTLWGAIPHHILDDTIAVEKAAIADAPGLYVKEYTMQRSLQAYHKSRSSATPLALHKMHEMIDAGKIDTTHPIFNGDYIDTGADETRARKIAVGAALLAGADLATATSAPVVPAPVVKTFGGFAGVAAKVPPPDVPEQTTTAVSAWRGAKTVFEEIKTNDSMMKLTALAAMTEKRVAHEKLIVAAAERKATSAEDAAAAAAAAAARAAARAAAPTSDAIVKHRSDFYLQYTTDAPLPDNFGAETALDAEEGAGRNIRTFWDAKRRRYITRNINQERAQEAERRESFGVRREQDAKGKWIETKANKGTYAQWCAKNKRRLQGAGEAEDHRAASATIARDQGRGGPKWGEQAEGTKTSLAAEHEMRVGAQKARKEIARVEKQKSYQREKNRERTGRPGAKARK